MSRFDQLVGRLKRRKHPPRNPRAVAAKIGRAKYGEKRFEEMAQEGKKMARRKRSHRHGHRPKGHKQGCNCVVCRRMRR